MTEEVTNRIFTLANIITFIRLILAPVAFFVLISGHDVAATILFAFTAATDCLDGQIARRTNTVSKLGQLLDPAVDRLLMICAVLGLLIINRLPLWIIVVVLARDALLLIGGGYLLKKYSIRVSVVYAGKVATTLLFIGLAGLMLNFPQVPGLGICNYDFFPGFNSVSTSWGIWVIYIGLLLSSITTVYYLKTAYFELKKKNDING